MLRTMNGERVWIIGAAAGAVVLAALAWFFLISPQNAQTSAINEQAAVEKQRVASLQKRLNELREQNQRLPAYEAELAAGRRALPRTPELAGLLRELHAAGTASRVALDGMTFGNPTPSTAGNTRAYSVPLSLTATGPGVDLERFLNQLQQLQPRAALISSVNATAEGETGSLAGSAILNITLQVFTTMQSELKTAN